MENGRTQGKRRVKGNLLAETRGTRLLAIDRLGFYTINLEKHHGFLSNKNCRTSDFSEANRERAREVKEEYARNVVPDRCVELQQQSERTVKREDE